MSLNIPESKLPRLVIIGGGFAGLSLIKHIDRKEFQVIMLDKNNYHTFQPLLYQVATGGLEVGSIAFPLRRYTKNFKSVIFRMAEVVEIISDKNEILTNIGPLKYDYLVIATGSENNFFGNKQLEENAVGLKNIPQALDIRSLMLQNFELASQTNDLDEREAMMNIVVAGGGPTGVEMAGSLAELKKHVLTKDYPELDFSRMKVVLIEGSDRILATMSKNASEKAHRFLLKMGVIIKLNVKLDDYDGDIVKLSDGSTIHSHALVWAAGVRGSVPTGISKNIIIRGNRIKTNLFNQLEDIKNIFVMGDVAACVSEQNPGGHPMVAPVAIQQGKLIATNLSNIKKGKELIPFSYHNQGTMATIGRNKAVVDLHRIKFQGTLAWFVWCFVHLMSIVGFRNKIVTFVDWVWNYISFDKALRLIIRPYKRDVKIDNSKY
jgi:NADH:ubiquinone reductase (H+-translocating)